jgi:plasmid stability protein
MAQIIVRKLDDNIKERLRDRARRHGRSLEAEARDILERTVARETSSKTGEKGWVGQLTRRMKEIGVTREDTEELERNIAELRRTWRARDLISGR